MSPEPTGHHMATTTEPTPLSLLTLANAAALAATALIHDARPTELHVEHKSTSTDMVTNMDLASEQLIRSIVADARPLDRFIGEESLGSAFSGPEDSTVTWIVDPIDGTTNYLYDLPGYNISIAAEIDGRTVAGVISDPTHNRIYSAALGAGSFCTTIHPENPDRVSDPVQLDVNSNGHHRASQLEHALIATGFAYDPRLRARQGEVVAKLLPLIRDIRRFGAAALDLCHVAAGRVDGYFEVNLGRWDLAAGALIATEAGARVGAINGGPELPGSVVAANPAIFEDLQQILEDLGAGTVLVDQP